MRPDPIPALKAALAEEIARLTAGRRTWDAAVLVQVHRSELSRIRNARLERISLERLIRILAHLHRRVELRIVVEPIPKPRAFAQR